MRRTCVLVIWAAATVALTVAPATATTWNLVGNTGWSSTAGNVSDYNRLFANAMVADGAGNVYSSVGLTGGTGGTENGGITIFKPGGATVNVDPAAAGYRGQISKMVVGGDGCVYALQNWLEMQYSYDVTTDTRILKIAPDGTLTEVVNRGNRGTGRPGRLITGMSAGPDGNIYFSTWGTNDSPDTTARNHAWWRYNVGTGVEELPPGTTGFNNGWSHRAKGNQLETTLNGHFAYLNTDGALTFGEITANTNRVNVGSFAGGWGHDGITAGGPVYDPVKSALWVPTRGSGNTNILTRYNNIDANGAPQDLSGSGGRAKFDVWHVVDYGASGTGAQWVTGLDTDTQGDAWFGYMCDALAQPSVQALRGHVWRYAATEWGNPYPMHDEGIPVAGADVMAVQYMNGGVYAMVHDSTTGLYTLYTTLPEPATLGLLLLGLPWLRRRRP